MRIDSNTNKNQTYTEKKSQTFDHQTHSSSKQQTFVNFFCSKFPQFNIKNGPEENSSKI